MNRFAWAPSLAALAGAAPTDMSPERQPDGRESREKAVALIELAFREGSCRFEWVARRFDGTEIWIDVVLKAMPVGERPVLLLVSREISEQKRVEEVSRADSSW